MSETHEGVHRHPAPTGFIRKYIFSLDHKVIGIQYILLALAAVAGRHDDVASDAPEPLVARNRLADIGNTVSDGCAGRRDESRVLSVARNDARHHHGLLCVDDCAAGWFRKLFSADTDWRRRYGVSGAEHDVVLGNAGRIHRHPARNRC